MMTREELQAAIEQQKARKDQCIAQANFAAGYLQCLMDVLEKIEVEKQEVQEPIEVPEPPEFQKRSWDMPGYIE